MKLPLIKLLCIILLSFATLLKAQPVANFTANKVAGCSPLTVQFTSTSTGSPTSYLWNFGNSNSSILQNPSATYVLPGTYTVTLTATNASGSDTKTKTNYITVYASPVANFTAIPLSGCAPLVVNFTDASTPGNGAINSWTWDFGDGNIGNTKNPTNTYALPGSYAVSLSVKDVNGCDNSLSKPAYITVTAPFVGDFTATGNISCTAPATVNFTSSTSLPGSYTYAWKFGDGGTSTQANPIHGYTATGNYDVELEITSSNGCKKTITKSAFVQIATLKANFTSALSTNCAPALLTLTNTSTPSPGALLFEWKLNGIGGTFTQNTSFIIADNTNEVTLIAKNSAGCIDSIKKTITLEARPDANFTTSKDTFCIVPSTVNFTDASTGNYSSWAWNFGNNLGSANANPSVTYTKAGSYTVRLIVSRGGSCKDTAYHNIIVAPPYAQIFAKNNKGGCAPITIAFNAIDTSLIPLTDWKWEQVGGPVVATTQNFSILFDTTRTGVFVYKLTATNSSGCVFIDYDTVIIGKKPKFDFTADRYVVCASDPVVKLDYTELDNIDTSKVQVFWQLYNSRYSVSGSGKHITVTLNDTGLFTIRVSALYNRCLNDSFRLAYIKVNPPIAKFEYTIDTCATDTVKFINKSIGQNKYYWDFKDSGATSTLFNPIHVYKNGGDYNVRLIANDTVSGCYDTTYRSLRILYPAKVKFTPLDTAVCLGTKVVFKDISQLDSSRSIKGDSFYVSDGRYGLNPSTTFPFNVAGTYVVKIIIMDNYNCKYAAPDSSIIKVYGGSASFSMTPNTGCAPLNVKVKDLSSTDNPIVSRKWVWSNLDSTTTGIDSANFIYTYASSPLQGTGFPLTFVATDSKGCTFKASKNIVPAKPKADFTVLSRKTCNRDSLSFSAYIDDATVLKPATFSWKLPFGGSSVTQNTGMAFSGDTILPFKLILTDKLGCKDTLIKNIHVNTTPPAIGFTANPSTIPCYKTKTPVFFNDTTLAGGSPIASRVWNIGDGRGNIPTLNKIYSAVYNKPGRFDVTLSVTDSVGCTSTLSKPEYVIAGGPVGNYTFNPRRGCNPLDVNFDVTSPNAALFIWDHADGNVDSFTTTHHSYQYNREGVYYPRLTLVDSSMVCDFGLDIIDSIVVLPLPKPDFTVDKTVICIGGFAHFTNTTGQHPAPIYNWKWHFGSGDSSLVKDPGNIQYDTSGLFMVKLEATDTNGCYGFIVKDSFLTVNDDTVPPETPFIKRATVIDDQSVFLEYSPNTEFDFGKYIIYSTTNQYNESNIHDTSLLEVNLTTLTTPYSYKMVAVDVCNNTSPMSEVHTTVDVQATGAINSIDVNWTPYNGFDTSKIYEIWRRKAEETDYQFLIKVSGDSLHYADTSVLCHQTYFYKIKTVETDSLLQVSWSDTSGASPIYVPILPIPQNIRATVSNNRFVRLEWHLAKHNRVFTYHVYRTIDSGEAVLYRTFASTDTVLVDENVDVQNHSYSYTTYVVDNCGGQSAPSNIAKTILLNVKMMGNDVLTHDPLLTWNAYSNWENGIQYYDVAFHYDSLETFVMISQNNENQLTQTHRYVNLSQADYCYMITAFKRGDTTITSESNIACVSTAPRLYAPNVFTINGDGLNDIFYVRGIFIAEFSLKIYDRWGRLVYESHNMNEGWDGKINGEAGGASDVFVYVAEGRGKRGERASITGNVTILK